MFRLILEERTLHGPETHPPKEALWLLGTSPFFTYQNFSCQKKRIPAKIDQLKIFRGTLEFSLEIRIKPFYTLIYRALCQSKGSLGSRTLKQDLSTFPAGEPSAAGLFGESPMALVWRLSRSASKKSNANQFNLHSKIFKVFREEFNGRGIARMPWNSIFYGVLRATNPAPHDFRFQQCRQSVPKQVHRVSFARLVGMFE